jgi:hypothetical protein
MDGAHASMMFMMGMTMALMIAVAYAYWLNTTAAPAKVDASYNFVYPETPATPPPPQPKTSPIDVRVSTSQPLPPDRPYVPSRATTDFHQVGFVYDEARTMRAPLYGRPAPRNPSRWQYFIRADNMDIRIGARKDGRACMEDVGCNELQTGDTLQVPELMEGDLTATVYDTAVSLTYRPW